MYRKIRHSKSLLNLNKSPVKSTVRIRSRKSIKRTLRSSSILLNIRNLLSRCINKLSNCPYKVTILPRESTMANGIFLTNKMIRIRRLPAFSIQITMITSLNYNSSTSEFRKPFHIDHRPILTLEIVVIHIIMVM